MQALPHDDLDQFYTPKDTVLKSVEKVSDFLFSAGILSPRYIEPSAGCGAFLEFLPSSTLALDLSPKGEGIETADFLTWNAPSDLVAAEAVVIGNPPFGIRGRGAVDFINRAAAIADTVAFILPNCFRKYAWQNKLDEGLTLQLSVDFPQQEFYRPGGGRAVLNTVFQIWSRYAVSKDLRKRVREPISHPDFVLRQYNNTPEAEKHFGEPFDFAVPCQGWQDYTIRESNPDNCQRNKQWMLVEASNDHVLDRLYNLNYTDLALRTGTTVPGFRKNDLVSAYLER